MGEKIHGNLENEINRLKNEVRRKNELFNEEFKKNQELQKQLDSLIEESREIDKINDGYHIVASGGIAITCCKFMNEQLKKGKVKVTTNELSNHLSGYVKEILKDNVNFIKKISKKKKSTDGK